MKKEKKTQGDGQLNGIDDLLTADATITRPHNR